MPRYRNNQTVQQQEHDRINTAMTGGHEDGASFGSLDLSRRSPNLRVKKSGMRRRKALFMYYDDEEQYLIKKVSHIRANDYVFAQRANNADDDTDRSAIYKACAEALDKGLFIFQRGEFDCANKFLETTGLYVTEKPAIEPNRLFPYYFRRDSPIKGSVTLDKIFVGDHLGGTRRIIVVNLETLEDLSESIPHRSVIYIGGDHSERNQGILHEHFRAMTFKEAALPSAAQREQTIEATCFPEENEGYRTNYMLEHVQTSSPCIDTWTAFGTTGPNIGVFMSKDERFLFCPTEYEPENDLTVCSLPLKEIPFSRLDSEAGFHKEYAQVEVDAIAEGAWVMKGNWLDTEHPREHLPSKVYRLLRSGFFRLEPNSIDIDQPKLASRLRRLVRSLKAMTVQNRTALGFHETEASDVYECKLSDVAFRLNVTIDILAALISEAGVGCTFFSGLVGYAGRRCWGPLRITDATPVGKWMIGRLYDTGTGLLYNDNSGTFLTIRTVNDVSYLGHCEEGRVLERTGPVLGKMLHGKASMWEQSFES